MSSYRKPRRKYLHWNEERSTAKKHCEVESFRHIDYPLSSRHLSSSSFSFSPSPSLQPPIDGAHVVPVGNPYRHDLLPDLTASFIPSANFPLSFANPLPIPPDFPAHHSNAPITTPLPSYPFFPSDLSPSNYCGIPSPSSPSSDSDAADPLHAPPHHHQHPWNCSACTLENDPPSTHCDACGAPQPPPQHPAPFDHDLEGDPSVSHSHCTPQQFVMPCFNAVDPSPLPQLSLSSNQLVSNQLVSNQLVSNQLASNQLAPDQLAFDAMLRRYALFDLKHRLVADGASAQTLRLIHFDDLIHYGVARFEARRILALIHEDELRIEASEASEARPQAREEFECKVCLERRIAVVLLPCAHAILCSGCAQDLPPSARKCPLCRTDIQDIMTIYFG